MKNKCLIFGTWLFALAFHASGQTGGGFAITQSVIAAGGGQNSAGGAFSLDGTTGQTVAGNASTHAPFTVSSGFWNFTTLAPTASAVSVSGRILTSDGLGLTNARVILTDSNGNSRTVSTGSFGFYRFDNVAAGQIYVVNIGSKRFTFAPQVISVFDNITELNFTANE
jgi:hypothetical protein